MAVPDFRKMCRRGQAQPNGLFDAVQLKAAAQNFAIDNLSTIPEPGAAAVILAGLAYGVARCRRRRTSG